MNPPLHPDQPKKHDNHPTTDQTGDHAGDGAAAGAAGRWARRGGRLIAFPTRSPAPAGKVPPGEDGSEFNGPMIDGEVINNTDDTNDARPARPGTAVVLRRAGVATRRHTIRAATATWAVATHPHTKRGGKAVARHVWHPIAGMGVLVKRWRDAHGAGRYERMMRHAELVGNLELLGDWEARDVAEKQRRHDRVMDWIHSPMDLIRALAAGFAGVSMLLLGLGIVLALVSKDISRVIAPVVTVIQAIAFTVWFFSVYGATLLTVGTVGFVVFLWHTGRSHTEPPMWMAPTEQGEEREVIPDERAILAALRNLNLGPLNRKFKEGWQPRWVLPTCRDGKGYRTQLELPLGVNVKLINEKKPILAHNLVRLPVEVWPTEPKDKPGVLDLWVADQGILTNPVDPYPLLESGTTDFFTGVPAGVDQRGELVIGKLMGCNYAVAGAMGSGKSSLVIELLCGAMLDPLVDIEVYVMAYNVDYDPMRPRLSVLVKGDEGEKVEAAIQAMQRLREEVTERGKLLDALGGEETKLTRELAERDPRMRPKIAVFDECQEMFRHERLGGLAKELAIKLMMKARKVGITLVFVTPAPSADSLPRDLAKTVSHGVCFAIGDHQGNDAILGTGAHSRGITAVDLVPGEDIGTAMASGFGPRPGLLRSHWIRKDKQVDQITPIVDRALKGWIGAQRQEVEPAGPVPRDLLTDVAAVLHGHDRLKATDVAARLREIAPDWAAYTQMTGEDLAVALEDAGAPVRKLKGTLTVRAGSVLAALADRADDDAGEDDEEDTDLTG